MTSSNSVEKKTIPFGGIFLILLGLFILFDQIFDLKMNGGIFLCALGLIFILWGATQRKAGLLVPGGILTGLSIGVILVEDAGTIPASYAEGAFVLALAAGFGLVTLIAQLFTVEKYWWAVIVAGILFIIGTGLIIMGLPNAIFLKSVIEGIFTSMQYLWPQALVCLGICIIFKNR